MFHSQIKWNLIFSVENLVIIIISCRRFLTWDLRKSGNLSKISKLCGDTVISDRSEFLTLVLKNTQKHIKVFWSWLTLLDFLVF